ncbi:syntaxin-17-like, partial [Saccoglossus kowalevskii]|uniref:Syntaxin-17-like n=1 Tax=Saccoglossus kowalevskii TaxID=10224 RepID=A0ABM0MF77_SACKO
YQRSQQWSKLNTEHINASRTVQQLKANVREMEKTRNQIRDEDLDEFDRRVQDIKEEAISAILGFIDLHAVDETPLSYIENVDQKNLEDHKINDVRGNDRENYQMPMSLDSHDPQQLQKQVQLHMDQTNAKESWDNLKDNLVELNTMIHDFSAMVHDQQEQVDSIVDNVEEAQSNVQQGVLDIGKAAKYKALMFPVAGAMLGGVVGGPIGLVAGAKIGLAAAVGGGVIGFTSGKIIKNRQDRANDIELQNLSTKQWKSAPDLSTEDLLKDTD